MKKEQAYRQYALVSVPDKLTSRVVWLDKTDLRQGNVVTLKKDDGRKWMVSKAYGTVISQPPERTWRVGGLF